MIDDCLVIPLRSNAAKRNTRDYVVLTDYQVTIPAMEGLMTEKFISIFDRKGHYGVVRMRKIDSAGFTLFHVQHGGGSRYTVVWREDGTTTAYAYGDRKIDGDDFFRLEGEYKDGFDHLADLLVAVVRDFIAGGGRSLDDELDEDAVKVIAKEHQEG